MAHHDEPWEPELTAPWRSSSEHRLNTVLPTHAGDSATRPLNMPDTKTRRVNRNAPVMRLEPVVSAMLIKLTSRNTYDAKGKRTPQRMGDFNGSSEYFCLQKVVVIRRL